VTHLKKITWWQRHVNHLMTTACDQKKFELIYKDWSKLFVRFIWNNLNQVVHTRGLHGVYNLIEVISSWTKQKLRSIFNYFCQLFNWFQLFYFGKKLQKVAGGVDGFSYFFFFFTDFQLFYFLTRNWGESSLIHTQTWI
jgi:hypothetical protein